MMRPAGFVILIDWSKVSSPPAQSMVEPVRRDEDGGLHRGR
jgi:hypothetical protein